MQVPALRQKRKQAPRIVMNELPVIGSLRLRKEFWDRQRENIVTRYIIEKSLSTEMEIFFTELLLSERMK